MISLAILSTWIIPFKPIYFHILINWTGRFEFSVLGLFGCIFEAPRGGLCSLDP